MDIPQPAGAAVAATTRSLQLNVLINDSPTSLIGSFERLPDGSIAAKPDELHAIGLRPPAKNRTRPDRFVRLDDLPGVTYRVDEAAQAIYVTAPDFARVPHIVDMHLHAHEDAVEPQRDWGSVVNYTLFASSDGAFLRDLETFQGLSGAFDARVFSPYGTLSQSMIASTGTGAQELAGLTRLDSTWTYADPSDLVTYRAGDFISGGLSWTRPVRLGGVQIQRSFALRPDLVTMPIPLLSGSAAVPSTLDVYTRNVKTFSTQVPAGPFQVTNFPVATGAGTASVVLSDALGRRTVTTLPFYASSQLLRAGLSDFSADLGFARRFYGVESDDYDLRPMGSASVRYGLNDRLTLEGHAEGGEGLLNAGAGLAFSLGSIGVASIAAAGSHADSGSGGLVNASLELGLGDVSVYARTQRTLGDYEDIASVTAPVESPAFDVAAFSARVPKAIDQVSLSVPLPFDRSALDLSYTQLESAEEDSSRTVGLSYSRTIFGNSSIFATAFKDIDDADSFGVFAGISVPLGNDITVTGGVQNGPTGTSSVVDAVKSEQLQTGSYGWRVHDSEGAIKDRAVFASYRASFARVQAGVEQFDKNVQTTAQIDGSVAFADGGVFFGNRIDDAFAVVDAGAPNVAVQYENRPVGVTDSRGLLLVPYLNSYQKNKISIDPTNLPVDAEVPSTKKVVVPADRSGVVVKFGVSENTKAALVTFVDAAGRPLGVGAQGELAAGGGSFVIGYDGQAYVRDLAAQNVATIELPDGGSCRAPFDYAPHHGQQVVISEVVCQ